MESPTTMNLGLKLIVESPSNPRKKFNAQKHTELTANVRLHGVLQALLVRPRWCVGISTRAELERLQGRGDLLSSPFELLAGARRFRAATAAELTTVPCTVRFFTDAEAFEIQLIENLQRDDLTPIEEAQGYHDALDLRIDGQAVHTVASLAARVGKDADHIYRLLPLVDLEKEFRDAIELGDLPVTQANLIARVPDRAARVEFGRQVLDGHGKNMPLTVREAEELRARDFMRELKGAPFDQEDPSLCAQTIPGFPDFERGSGRCSDCQYRSGNMSGFEGKRGDVCTAPECYALKSAAAFDRIAAAAEAVGNVVLRTGDAARHFDPLGELVFTTTLVRLAAKPREDQLKAEVRRAPTWAALRETAIEAGLDVPIYVTRNPKTGVVEELLDSAPLIAAAKMIGEPIFRGTKDDEPMFTPKKDGEDDDDAFRRRQSELSAQRGEEAKADAAKRLKAEAQAQLAFKAVLEQVADEIRKGPGGIGWIWDTFSPSFVAAAGAAGMRFVAKTFGLKVESGEFGLVDAVQAWIDDQKGAQHSAASLMLLLSNEVAAEGVGAQDLRSVASVLGIDLDNIATEKPKPAKPKKHPAKAPKAAKKSKPAKKAKKPAAKRGKKRGVK